MVFNYWENFITTSICRTSIIYEKFVKKIGEGVNTNCTSYSCKVIRGMKLQSKVPKKGGGLHHTPEYGDGIRTTSPKIPRYGYGVVRSIDKI